MSSLSPLLISAAIGDATNGLAVNGTASINPTTIGNPNRTPMLIDQFSIVQQPGGELPSFSQELRMNLQLGNMPLTNGFVSARAIMPAPKGPFNTTCPQTMTWHLPKPLYVPPDVQLSASFMRVPLNGETGICPANFVIRGRSVASGTPIPQTIFAPWAATATQELQRDGDGGPDRYITPDNALGNPFDHDMIITRLLGYMINGEGSGEDEAVVLGARHTVKLTLSNGKMLIRDPVPFWLLFPRGTNGNVSTAPGPLATGYFDILGKLRPKEFIKGVVDYAWASGDIADAHINNMLGMVGYHEIQTPRGDEP